MSVFIPRFTPFRLQCDHCGALSCLHFFDVVHARKQMMEIPVKEGPWRCQKIDDRGGLIEDVCDTCVKKEEKVKAEKVAAVLALEKVVKELKKGNIGAKGASRKI